MKSFVKTVITAFLLLETKLILAKYKPRIIAVTGSVGKTTTKDAIYDVLKDHVFIRKNEKSYNSEIGLPLTVIGADNAWSNIAGWVRILVQGLVLIVTRQKYPEWLVLEMGADRPGDIKKLATIARPDIAILTWLGEVPVHVEFFDSPEALFHEKMEIVRALKDDGVVIYNSDDTRLATLIETEGLTQKKIRYGSIEECEVCMSNIDIAYDNDVMVGVSGQVTHKGERNELRISGTVGQASMYSYLAGIAVADELNLSHISYERNIQNSGRMRLLKGFKESTIIDDSYNASPAATYSALEVLGRVSKGRKKIAVLGDMLELGKYSAEEHKKIGEAVARVADRLVTVGVRAKAIAIGAKSSGMENRNIAQFDDTTLAKEYVREQIKKGDVILVKGSQGIRMEKIVERILLEPEKASELLVRQDSAWKGR